MRFGARTAEVERFLAWYRDLPVTEVVALVERSLTSAWVQEAPEVGQRITQVGLAAPLRSAFERALQEAALAKTAAGLDLGRKRTRLGGALSRTLQAIAVREHIDPADFAFVTRAFREAGYDFDVATDPDGQT